MGRGAVRVGAHRKAEGQVQGHPVDEFRSPESTCHPPSETGGYMFKCAKNVFQADPVSDAKQVCELKKTEISQASSRITTLGNWESIMKTKLGKTQTRGG